MFLSRSAPWRRQPATLLLLMVGLIVVVVGAFLGFHFKLECRYLGYSRSLLENAVGTYQIGSNETGDWILLAGGKPFDELSEEEQADAAPLGVGRYASTQGVLSDLQGSLEEINELYRGQSDALLNSIRSRGSGGAHLLPTASLLGELEPAFLSLGDAQLQFLKSRPGIGNFSALQSTLASAPGVQFRSPTLEPPKKTSPPTTTEPTAPPPATPESASDPSAVASAEPPAETEENVDPPAPSQLPRSPNVPPALASEASDPPPQPTPAPPLEIDRPTPSIPGDPESPDGNFEPPGEIPSLFGRSAKPRAQSESPVLQALEALEDGMSEIARTIGNLQREPATSAGQENSLVPPPETPPVFNLYLPKNDDLQTSLQGIQEGILSDAQTELNLIDFPYAVPLSPAQSAEIRKSLLKMAKNALSGSGDYSKIQTPTEGREQLEADFHARLTKTIEKEVGFFFTLGNYRWIDVIFFAMVGVLIQGCVRLAHASANREAAKKFGADFPETVFAKLFYAPLLVILVMFVIDYVNAPEAQLEVNRGSLALLAFASWLGMHPHSAYRLLRRAFKALVSDDIASTQHTTQPTHHLKESKPVLPAPTDVGTLKSNLQTISARSLKATTQ